MKIVGTIYDYSEAQEFENIIKVYFLEERISNLYNNHIHKLYKKTILNEMGLAINNKSSSSKNNRYLVLPIFGIRGLI